MSRSVVVDSDLTVTVHDDGRVTWSSSFPMTPPRVARTIMSAAARGSALAGAHRTGEGSGTLARIRRAGGEGRGTWLT